MKKKCIQNRRVKHIVHIVIYRDRKREYRWHMKRNGRIIAASGEGYKRVAAVRKTLIHMMNAFTFDEYDIFQVDEKAK